MANSLDRQIRNKTAEQLQDINMTLPEFLTLTVQAHAKVSIYMGYLGIIICYRGTEYNIDIEELPVFVKNKHQWAANRWGVTLELYMNWKAVRYKEINCEALTKKGLPCRGSSFGDWLKVGSDLPETPHDWYPEFQSPIYYCPVHADRTMNVNKK